MRDMVMTIDLSPAQALRLAAWLSPSFPIGAFSYSHGLEYAVETGFVTDQASLLDWLSDLLEFGSGRNEAIFFATAWRSAADRAALLDVAALAAAMRPTAELALETEQQAAAFLETVAAAWPSARLQTARLWLAEAGVALSLPVVAGVACRLHELPLRGALTLYLHAFAANLVSAGVRLVPLGQTAGQRVTAALEPAVLALAEAGDALTPDDLGSAGALQEICSMAHETQYTRLFRS